MKWSIFSGPSIVFAAVMAMSIMSGQAEEYEPAPLLEQAKGVQEATGKDQDGLLDKMLDRMAGVPTIAEAGPEQTPAAAAAEEAVEPESPAVPGLQSVLTATTRSIDPDAVQVVGEGMELHVQDLEIASALQLLSLQAQRNIVVSKEVKGTVSANLYNVTFHEAMEALLRANGFAYREKGGFIYVYTAEGLAALEESERIPLTRVYKLSYLSATDASILITPALSGIGQVAISPPAQVGIPSGAGDTGGDSDSGKNTLVIYDYQENLAQIERILVEVDVRPQQVLLEATILQATLDEDNALGIDFNVLAGIDFRDMSSISNGGNNLLTGTVSGDNLASELAAFGTDFAANVPGGGLSIGVITNNAAIFVRALEEITDTTVLANPKVLALNKQRGEVHIGRRDGYITTTVTETTATQTVEFLDTGTQLLFRPFIGNDGFIRLEIHPEDSNGGLTADNLPFEVTTTVTSNIMVKDGHTVVIGGLFRERTTTTRSQIPLLGDIPVAGALFRNSRDTTVREEVIILITPHIIKDYEIENEIADSELERIRDITVGMRDGLQPFGRERLAQTYYKRAFRFSEEGNIEKAIWNAKMAVEMLPMFLDAINLRDRLMNQRNWEADTGMMRTMIYEIVRSERISEGKKPHPTPSWYMKRANVPATSASAQAMPLPAIALPEVMQNDFAGAESPVDPDSEVDFNELDAGPDPSVENIEASLNEFYASQEETVPSTEEESDAVVPNDASEINIGEDFNGEYLEDVGFQSEFLEEVGDDASPSDSVEMAEPSIDPIEEVAPVEPGDETTTDQADLSADESDDVGYNPTFLEDIDISETVEESEGPTRAQENNAGYSGDVEAGASNFELNQSRFPALDLTVDQPLSALNGTGIATDAGSQGTQARPVISDWRMPMPSQSTHQLAGEPQSDGSSTMETTAIVQPVVAQDEQDEDSELLYADPTVDESDVE